MGNRGPTILRIEEPGLPVIVNVRAGSALSVLSRTCCSPDDLRAQLNAHDPLGVLRRAVQTVGCAMVRDTNLKGISAVAAPFYDYTGRLRAALTTGAFDTSRSRRDQRAARLSADAAVTGPAQRKRMPLNFRLTSHLAKGGRGQPRAASRYSARSRRQVSTSSSNVRGVVRYRRIRATQPVK
jgi:hypothetical protein